MDLQAVLDRAATATDPIGVLVDADWDRWVACVKPCGHPMSISQCGDTLVMFAEDDPEISINQFDGEAQAVDAWRHGVAALLAAQMVGEVTHLAVGGTVDLSNEPTVPFVPPYVV